MKKRLLSFLLVLCMVISLLPGLPVYAASNEQQVYDYLTGSMGLNRAAACGVMANIEKESSFNPNAIGDSGTSYGICQWHNSRWDALKNYCNNHGYDWTTVNGQLHYLESELKTSYYYHIYTYLTERPDTEQGAYDAAYYWCVHFEVPADKYNVAVTRGNLAKNTYWPKYGGSDTTAPTVAELHTDHTNYEIDEVVTFTCNTNGNVNNLWIYCPNDETLTYKDIGSSLKLGFGMAGHYTALVQTWNSVGSCTSDLIDFYVGNPTYSRLSIDKSTYYRNERVVFHVSTDGIVNVLWIYCPDGQTLTYSDIEDEYDLGFGMTGTFRALIQTWNGNGSLCSEEVEFTIVCRHDYTESVTAPTCAEQGYTTYTCSICGNSYVADYVDALGHDFGEWVETTAPTCTEKGVETRYCSRCDATDTREVDALGHNYVDGKCTNCEAIDPDYKPVTNAGKLVVSDVRARAGEEVTVSVSIENNPGIMVMALGIDYDKSKLELVGYEDGIMTGWKVATNAVWIGADDVTANGVILKLKFKVLDDVVEDDIQVSLLFSEGDIANHNEEIIMPEINNGTIIVKPYIPGDVTGDGKVNALDLVRLQRYLSGEDVVIGGSCDITGDGKINALDLVRLQRYLSGEEVVVC